MLQWCDSNALHADSCVYDGYMTARKQDVAVTVSATMLCMYILVNSTYSDRLFVVNRTAASIHAYRVTPSQQPSAQVGCMQQSQGHR